MSIEEIFIGAIEKQAAAERKSFLVEGSWAVLGGDEITGMIFFHQCDESEFKSKKANPT